MRGNNIFLCLNIEFNLLKPDQHSGHFLTTRPIELENLEEVKNSVFSFCLTPVSTYFFLSYQLSPWRSQDIRVEVGSGHHYQPSFLLTSETSCDRAVYSCSQL